MCQHESAHLSVHVWVHLPSLAPERLLDVIHAGVRLHTQHLIVVCCATSGMHRCRSCDHATMQKGFGARRCHKAPDDSLDAHVATKRACRGCCHDVLRPCRGKWPAATCPRRDRACPGAQFDLLCSMLRRWLAPCAHARRQGRLWSDGAKKRVWNECDAWPSLFSSCVQRRNAASQQDTTKNAASDPGERRIDWRAVGSPDALQWKPMERA